MPIGPIKPPSSAPTPTPRPGGSGIVWPWSSRPQTPKPIAKPTAPPKELEALSKRMAWRGVETKNIIRDLKSHKGQIFQKYGVKGKDVDQRAAGLKKYNVFTDPREARSLEKTLGKKAMHSSNAKEKEESRKWLKILRDPKIFKK